MFFVRISPLALLLLAASLARAAEPTSQPMARDVSGYNLPADHLGIQGYSPVSYFEKGKAEKGVKFSDQLFVVAAFDLHAMSQRAANVGPCVGTEAPLYALIATR